MGPVGEEDHTMKFQVLVTNHFLDGGMTSDLAEVLLRPSPTLLQNTEPVSTVLTELLKRSTF